MADENNKVISPEKLAMGDYSQTEISNEQLDKIYNDRISSMMMYDRDSILVTEKDIARTENVELSPEIQRAMRNENFVVKLDVALQDAKNDVLRQFNSSSIQSEGVNIEQIREKTRTFGKEIIKAEFSEYLNPTPKPEIFSQDYIKNMVNAVKNIVNRY